MNKQLPLFEEKNILPTNKKHVSFSEINYFLDCSYRHKLKYIDKISLQDSSIHTVFGGAVHDAIEQFLLTKKEINPNEVILDFEKRIKEQNINIEKSVIQEFSTQIPDILSQVPGFLDTTFPEHKVIAAEFPLFESIEYQQGVYLKGFIDAIFKVPKKRGKGTEYILCDWKTTSWGWKPDQKQNFQKQLQLMLYKYFFCQLMNIPHEDVKCGFILIKRIVPKNRKPFDRLELVPVSVGPKSIDKTKNLLHDMINKVKKGYFIKNRLSCEPFCPYYNTIHCK